MGLGGGPLIGLFGGARQPSMAPSLSGGDAAHGQGTEKHGLRREGADAARTCRQWLAPRPPNVPLLKALWSLLDGIWGVLKRSWGGGAGCEGG